MRVLADLSANRYTGPWNATTRNPILVIGTQLTPTRRFATLGWLTGRLGNAVLLVHDGYGHTSHRDPSTCVIRATSRYLVNLTTPPPGPSARPTASPSTRLRPACPLTSGARAGLRGQGICASITQRLLAMAAAI